MQLGMAGALEEVRGQYLGAGVIAAVRGRAEQSVAVSEDCNGHKIGG